MDKLLELFHTHKDNATTAVGTPAKIETVIQPIPNQSGSLLGSSGYVDVYPWGITQNFTPQVANGGSFVPYQPAHLPPINGNTTIHP